MELVTLLIALAAILLAIWSLSKHSDTKLQLSRLRRDFENYKRLSGEPHAPPLAIDTPAEPAAAALNTPEPRKIAPDVPPKDLSPHPNWAEKAKSASAAPQPLKQSRPKVDRKSFEEALGAQWSVWVGGLALFLGAVFLLRYSIEAGVFTPVMRVAMTSLFGLCLLGVSEWLHRVDQTGATPSNLTRKLGFLSGNKKPRPKTDGTAPKLHPITEIAHIPGILAAVGIFSLLGAVYASYALYGFIGPTLAFILLGFLSLGAMALSLRHGPILAALGLAASLATPLLVTAKTPSVYILYGYLIIVAAAAISVARLRNWGWLTLLTLASLLGWSMLSIDASTAPSTLPIWYAFLGLAFAANVWLAEPRQPKQLTSPTANEDGSPAAKQALLDGLTHSSATALAWGAIAALLIMVVIVNAGSSYHARFFRLDYALSLAAVAAFFAVSFRFPAQRGHVYAGAVIGAVAIWTALKAKFGLPAVIGVSALLSAGVIALTTFPKLDAAGFKTQTAATARGEHIDSVFAVGFPLVLFGVMRDVGAGLSDTMVAIIFLALAAVNAAVAYLLRGKDGAKKDAAIFAIGTALSYVIAAALAFNGMTFTFAILLGLVIAAGAAWLFGDKLLRMFVPAFAGLSAAHTLLIQFADPTAISAAPITNELWIYLALPAALCGGAAWWLDRKESDLWSEGLKALALAFAALFVVFQIRHLMNGGNILAERFSFDELALQVLTGFCFTLGGAKIGRMSNTLWTYDPKAGLEHNLLPAIMTGVSLLTLLAFAVGVCFGKAPLLNSSEFVNGNAALNSLALGYLLPALALGGIAWLGQNSRPQWYLRLVSALAALAAVLYITSMIRFGFIGRDISLSTSLPKGLELYAISAAWLLLGIGALIIGMKTNRQDVRLASALLITLTVLKAFLIDMASLEGVLRAMSFVVLGIVLIVIGRAYQKLLAQPKAPS